MASLTYELTLAGLAIGSAAALTGIGLIVTYRATGALNLAHGAIAMVCAYVLRQFVVGWGWPLPLAACLTLLVVAPGIGLALDRAVFRPLSVLGSDPARTLVASIGVFVLLVGGAALVWGGGARADAPVLLSDDPWLQLTAALLTAAAVGAATRWTPLGRELRAVVDNRELAALGGIDADRVSAAGWAFGSFTAGLTGVLLAPYVRLDPYGLPLLVVEVIAVAVVARMRSLPVAVASALAIGVAQAQMTRLHPSGWAGPLVQAVGANLFVVALLIAALAMPGVGTRDALPRTATAGVRVPPGLWLVTGVLFLLPLGLAGADLHTSVQVPALALILLSLVVVTGRGGQISLGQAAYAGLGALFTALLAAGRFPGLPRLPELVALLVAVVLVAPLGLLTGWPAIGRRGLALALATLAVGVAVSRFVFAQPYATAGLELGRPAGLADDRAYYLLELLLLACALAGVAALRRGRTGRALAALRDHESGAAAAGVPVPSLKLLAFVTGAALAALGGGLLGMGLRAFDPEAYDPVRGLLWFAAIVVLGADSLLSPLAAAALLVGLDAGTRGGVAAATIGLLAALTGRVPPLTSLLSRLTTALPCGAGGPRAVRDRLDRARRGRDRQEGPARPGSRWPRRRWAADTATEALRSGGRGTAGAGTGAEATAGLGPRWPRRRAADTATEAPPSGRGRTVLARLRLPWPARGLRPRPRRAAGTTTPAPPGQPPHGPRPDQPLGDGPRAPGPAEGPRARGAPGSGGSRPRAGRGAPGPGGKATTARLWAEGLVVRYAGVVALDGVGLDVAQGRVTALVGANGAGKSTLFHCLAGTVRPDAGRVVLDGVEVTARPAYARSRLGVARTFQQLAVFPSLTVEENVRVGAEQGRVRDPGAVEQALRLFALDGPVRHRPTAALDTGTLRRVELARALAGRPHTLLLDEPAAGLDAAETAALARVLRALAADGLAVLVVEHDPDLVAGIADAVHVMEAGRIVS
ncbi:ATP-binding cassette domain-containing protein [Streptomyces purpureus]|uniref:ABC transporter permease subunit n=1 Tax=Streptomyces purpureus TaxID=1951 RepID=UPI0037BDA998